MTPEERLTPQQRALSEAIGDIGEARWCAGWLVGIEYQRWAERYDGGRLPGSEQRDHAQLEKVRALSVAVDGWMLWADDQRHPQLPSDEWGPRFVSTFQRLDMVAAERRVLPQARGVLG